MSVCLHSCLLCCLCWHGDQLLLASGLGDPRSDVPEHSVSEHAVLWARRLSCRTLGVRRLRFAVLELGDSRVSSELSCSGLQLLSSATREDFRSSATSAEFWSSATPDLARRMLNTAPLTCRCDAHTLRTHFDSGGDCATGCVSSSGSLSSCTAGSASAGTSPAEHSVQHRLGH